MKCRIRDARTSAVGFLLGVLLLAGCKAETQRGWDIPTEPQERAAYDYAHSLQLPDSVPEPVPFDFLKARVKALWPGNQSVSDQYFEHLCKTEAGEYIFRTVENVEGVFQMRPRQKPGELNYDRYAPEDPTGFGWSHDVDQFHEFYVASIYVQPMMGEYLLFERPMHGVPDKVLQYRRELNQSPPPGNENGMQTVVPGKYSWVFSLPFMVVKEEVPARSTRYAFVWRGIRREHDRYYSIASGEYLIVDLDTNEVLAVKRRFKISGRGNAPSRIWWENARPCNSDVLWRRKGLTPALLPIDQFVKKVLVPVQGINAQYIPPYYRKELDER